MQTPISEIKPSIKKAFISNILFVSVIVVLIIGTLIYLNSIVGLDIFIDTFREVGIEISSASLLFWFIVIILFVTGLLLILNYVNLGKVSYILYPDKLVYTKSSLIQHKEQEVPYANIAKITSEKKSFLKPAEVTIELTGMKESKVAIKFLENPEEIVMKIQELVRQYRANYYAKYSQDYRYQNIMDKL